MGREPQQVQTTLKERQRMDKILSYDRNDEHDYYKILGCSELSTVEQITTEYRARVLECHPDKHPEDAKAAERFALLSKAKDTLTDPEKRSKYDKWHRSGIAISYEDWCGLRGAVHTSMHWATKAPQPQLAADSDNVAEPSGSGKPKGNLLESASNKPRERSPSPRQHSPYHKAQRVDLTFFSRDKPFVTGDEVNWTPQTGSDMLRKFRNYQI